MTVEASLLPHQFETEGIDHLNSYLSLAYLALRLENRPLHCREILAAAKRYKFFPPHLKGKTPHKTLNARLSEHIRQQGASSIFFRTAPATYYLSKLAEALPPEKQPSVFHGVRRDKSIKKENVLVADRTTLGTALGTSLTRFDASIFDRFLSQNCHFMDRSLAEQNTTVKQFVTFTIFHYRHNLLIYRRGQYSTASDELKGAYSVGFGGHVNDTDFTLFATGSKALVENSSRELMEELYLSQFYKDIDELSARSSIMGLINVDDSADAQQHVAVLVKFAHKSKQLPKKGELSINGLRWLNTKTPLNDTSEYDLWSRIILNGIYSGEIALDHTT